ncbi:hypothetical protein EYC80_002037 [Monilinia laxa]|uniref:Uncharacterized protein n=1 Tax=Monilinia laxa TaxID=61186 RepID=A0A5N6K6S6_MONLA|nr:hypothetical protein EYC80_002037 [Monilinia laxa]
MPHVIEPLVDYPQPGCYLKRAGHEGRRSGTGRDEERAKDIIKAIKAGKAKRSREVSHIIQRLCQKSGQPSTANVLDNSRPYQKSKEDSTIDSCIMCLIAGANLQPQEHLKRIIREGGTRPSGRTFFESFESEIVSLPTEIPSTIPKAGGSPLKTTSIGPSSETKDLELQDESYAKPTASTIEDFERPSPLQVEWAAVALAENGANSQRVIDQMFKRFKWHPDLLLRSR